MRSGTICALCFEPSSKLLHSSSLASLIASLLQFLVDNPDVHSFSFKGKPFSRRPAAHTSNMRCQGITCLAVLNKWHQILVFTCLATVRRPACQLRPWHGHPREPELAVGAHGGAVTPLLKVPAATAEGELPQGGVLGVSIPSVTTVHCQCCPNLWQGEGR